MLARQASTDFSREISRRGDNKAAATSAADGLLLDDVLALLDYVIEDLLKCGQVIVVPNHGQLANQGRVMVFLGLLVPDLRLKIR